MIASNSFFHNNIEYAFKWAQDRHSSPQFPKAFNQRLESYFKLILSKNVPEYLFNDPQVLRCSTFRIKGLRRGGFKEISFNLIRNNIVQVINPKAKNPKGLSSAIIDLPKIAMKAYTTFESEFHQNPGHNPILYRILYENQNAISLETPVWTTPQRTLKDFSVKPDQFSFACATPFTGHIDLTLYDETDDSLVIADYKPEREYIKSLPQVAIYGLVLKHIFHLKNVKCVSFSTQDGWVYDPEIIRNEVIQEIEQYGNPDLAWRKILQYI